MKTPFPFPDPPREIFPSAPKRFAFALLNSVAVAVRALSFPSRFLRRRRAAAAAAGKGEAEPRRVVVLEPFGMGDAFLLQPLVRAWLGAGASVAFAGRESFSSLFPPHPRFEFVAVNPRWAGYGAGALSLLRDFAEMPRRLGRVCRGSLCICPRGDVRAVIGFWLAGADAVRTLPRYFSANDCRVWRLAADLAPLDRMATRRVVSKAFAPPGAPDVRPSVEHLRPGLPRGGTGAGGGAVGLIPLATAVEKQWPARHWKALAELLRGKGLKFVVLCGPGERELALAETGLGQAETLSARSPAEWVENIAGCRAVVSVNTGPMHLADAMDKPLVVVDGASRLPLWAPEGEHATVLHRQDIIPSVPVHFRRDRSVRETAMALVTPEMVLDALLDEIK